MEFQSSKGLGTSDFTGVVLVSKPEIFVATEGKSGCVKGVS